MKGIYALLDTSVYSQRQRKHPHPMVVSRWKQLGDDRLAISAICEAEILFGLEKKNSARLWTEYRKYLENRLVMLPVDKQVTNAFGNFRLPDLDGICFGAFR